MNEQGIVKEVYEDHIDLSIIRHEACASCSAGSLCHPGVEKIIEVYTSNTAELSKGDKVNLEIEPEKVLMASFLVYVLPLLGMGLGITIATILNLSENYTIAISFAGLFVMLLVLMIIEKKIRKNKTLNIKVVK